MGGTRYPRSFAFRLTEEDGERLDAVAAAEGISSGEWARRAIGWAVGIGYDPRRARRRFRETRLIRETLAELSRQGSNLNQLARALNGGEATCREARQALETIHADHHAALIAVLDAIGAGREP